MRKVTEKRRFKILVQYYMPGDGNIRLFRKNLGSEKKKVGRINIAVAVYVHGI